MNETAFSGSQSGQSSSVQCLSNIHCKSMDETLACDHSNYCHCAAVSCFKGVFCYFLKWTEWPTPSIPSLEVLVTLTTDVGKILASLHRVQSKGDIKFLTAVKIAHVSINYCGNY